MNKRHLKINFKTNQFSYQLEYENIIEQQIESDFPPKNLTQESTKI